MNAQPTEGFARLVAAIRSGRPEPLRHPALRETLEFALSQLARRTQSFDVAEYRILTVLSHADGMNQQVMAERTAMDRTTTSEALRRLEQQQLLRRARDGRDRRRLLILASPGTQRAAAEAAEAARKAESEALSGLSDAERAQLAALLGKAL